MSTLQKNDEKCELSHFTPPPTNRGVLNTSGLLNKETQMSSNEDLKVSTKIVVDWLQVTIKDYIPNVLDFLVETFGLDKDLIYFEPTAMFGYKETFGYRDIKVFYNPLNKDLGVHLYISGKGCRDVEELGIDFLQLFEILYFKYEKVNFTRIDIAIDTFNDNYYNLDLIKQYINNNQVVTKLRSFIHFYKGSLSYNDTLGETIQFGSLTSNFMLVFYNKKLEREDKSYIVDEEIFSWVRCEIRLRNDLVNNFVIDVIKNNYKFSELVYSLLYNYVDFKDFSTDVNRSRWTTSQWWLDFLSTTKQLSLCKARKESDITTKKKWLDTSVSKTQLLYLLSCYEPNTDIDNFTLSYLLDNLLKGNKKLTNKDKKMINDYRITNKYNPINNSDIENYLNTLYNIIIKSHP